MQCSEIDQKENSGDQTFTPSRTHNPEMWEYKFTAPKI